MPSHTPDCHRCGGPMTVGMLVERDHAVPRQVRWVSGERRDGVGGAILGEASGDRFKFYVTAWRCPKCGVLESFALEED